MPLPRPKRQTAKPSPSCTAVGTRFTAVAGNAKSVGVDPSQRDSLGQHGINFQADGTDSAFYLAQF
jgi:hypothetical protein